MLALFCKWLFWVVGAALLGFLLAWLMKGAKANDWRTQFEDKDASYKRLKGNHNGYVSKYEELERSSNKLRTTNSTLKKDLSTQESKISKLMSQLKAVPAAAATAAVVSSSNGSSDNSYEIRAWESKYSRLERELATKSEMFEELKENNETLNTKMEVLALTTEEAKKEQQSALGKLKQYEEYRPRFEEANLERNTLKYKYEQLSSQNAAATNEQKEIKTKYDSLLGLQERTEVKMKSLKEQVAASASVPAVATEQANTNTEELENYKARLQALTQENEKLKGSLEESMSAISQAKANDSTAEIANWADKHKVLSEENSRLKADLERSRLATAQAAPPATNEYEQKWNALKQEEATWTNKHNSLSEENNRLKAALEQSKATKVQYAAASAA